MKKLMVGLVAGSIGALINVAFLFMAPDLEVSVFIVTAVTWLVIGFFNVYIKIGLNGILKGILVAVLVSASNIIYTLFSSSSGVFWTIFNTVLWGAMIGFAVDVFMKKHDITKK